METPSAWLIGVVAIILQAWMSSSGLALQRQAKVEMDQRVDNRRRAPYSNKMIFGVLIYVCSFPLNLLAVTMAPISVIGALSACVYIVNSTVWAWRGGEIFTKTDVLAIIFGLVGCIGIVYCAPKPKQVGDKELTNSLKLLNF